MGNTAGVFATSCAKCQKVYIFTKYRHNGEFWQYWREQKTYLYQNHECEIGCFTKEDFTNPITIIRNKDTNTDLKDLKIYAMDYLDKKYPGKRLIVYDPQICSEICISSKERKVVKSKIDDIFYKQENIDELIISYEKSLVLGCIKRNYNKAYIY